MKTIFKKAVLGTALAATAAVGMLAVSTPAQAQRWGGYYRHGGGGGAAVAAGLVGLAAGVAIASDHGPYVAPAPVGYYAPPPVAYGGCYAAYPGYDGYCYPVSYYTNLGWGWHDGYWWYGGARYARPFAVGGYRGGYGYHGGYRGGYGGGYGGGYHGGYAGGGYHGGYGGGGHAAYAGGGHGGYGGGHAGGGHGHR